MVTPEVLKSYDGLGFLKAITDGTVPNPLISELLGFHLIEVEQGRAVFEGLPKFHHYNPIGTVHGGFAATLLDSALGCAIISRKSGWLDYARAEVQPGASTDKRIPGPRTWKVASCTDAQSRRRRRSEGSRGKALCARYHDVHDLTGEGMKINYCRRRSKDAGRAVDRSANSSCGAHCGRPSSVHDA